MRYVTQNLLTVDTLEDTLTEDPLYVDDWLYDNRPSRPFRFTAKAAQWIKIHFPGGAERLTFWGIFNHNLVSAGTIRIEGNSVDAWPPPAWPAGYSQVMTWREFDMHQLMDQTWQWWRLYIDKPANIPMPQVGELYIGRWCAFNYAKVQPSRDDPQEFVVAEKQTYYGQDWDYYLSESQAFRISLVTLTDPAAAEDEVRTFLTSIGGASGRWVFIPYDDLPPVYFVKVRGSPSAERPVYGERELRNWSIDIKALTRGVTTL